MFDTLFQRKVLKLVGLFVVIITFMSAKVTWACSVCGANDGDIFLYSTILLSVLPLTIGGLIIWWIYRQYKKKAQVACEK